MMVNDAELNQSLEQLERMDRALAALRREVFPANPRQFALLAESPEEEIRRLQEAIVLHTGRNELAELDASHRRKGGPQRCAGSRVAWWSGLGYFHRKCSFCLTLNRDGRVIDLNLLRFFGSQHEVR